VSKGNNHLFELGALLTGFYKFEVIKNVFVENKMSIYSDYLGKSENINFDYSLTANMKVNEYINTLVEIHLVYDENAVKALQCREVFGVGVSLTL